MKSQYIQRKRSKGFNLQAASPDGRPVVSCTRPSLWDNPYDFEDKAQAVNGYVAFIKMNDGLLRAARRAEPDFTPGEDTEVVTSELIRTRLQGKHLACWCAPGEPCHVQDVILPILNGKEPSNY